MRSIVAIATLLLNFQNSLAQLTSPFINLYPNGVSNIVAGRKGFAFNFDKKGGFYAGFGAIEITYFGDLWYFNRDTRTWSFLDGSNSTDAAGIVANKPTPRYGQASFVDNSGNLWMFGGHAWGGGSRQFTSETWVYNVTLAGWRTVSAGGPRVMDMGSWKEESDNSFYVFGGWTGSSYSQSTWRMDPTVANPTWQSVTVGAAVPAARREGSCDAAPVSGAYCFGGLSAGGRVGDFWQFTPTPTPEWTLLSSVDGPSARNAHKLIVNRALGQVHVLLGLASYGYDAIMWTYSIAKQQWTSMTTSPVSGRRYLQGDLDTTKNMIYIFGGYSGLNDLWAVTCLRGQFNDAGVCALCPEKTFSSTFNATSCTTCPSNSFSTPGSSECICNAGYQRSGTSCVPCVAGTFKDNAGNAVCTLCPANTYSTTVGATSNNTCVSCGTNMGSNGGSSMCFCNAGYGLNGSSCVICPAGSYKTGLVNTTCTLCAANTYSTSIGGTSSDVCIACSTGLVSLQGSSSCVCPVGSELIDSNCSICKAGFFKSSIGNASCTACAENQYSNAGATSCLSCGVNSATPIGSSSCSCIAGYQWNGSTCVACPAGTFKSSSNNGTCIPCGINTDSLSGSASCACKPGYQLYDSQSCIACAGGTYKTNLGNSTCTPCVAGTYSKVIAASSSNVCLACGLNSFSVGGSVSCTCNAGYEVNGTSCSACSAGSYKTANGNFTCTKCPIDTYSVTLGATSPSTCLSCGLHLTSPLGSSSCTCRSGYEPIGRSSVACSKGTFKSTNGNETCTLCSANTYSVTIGATSSNSCMQCSANSVSNAGSTSCSCNAGYEAQGNDCVACPVGKFKALAGNTSLCTACSAGQSSLVGSSTCYTLPIDCLVGQEPRGGICAPCTAGTYKQTIGNTSCTSCSANQYSLSGSYGCLNCAKNSGSSPGSAVCSCNSGYFSNGNTCTACPENTFKSVAGNQSCTPCGENTSTNGTSCFCLLTHYGDPLFGCLSCPDLKMRTVETESYTSEADCIVEPEVFTMPGVRTATSSISKKTSSTIMETQTTALSATASPTTSVLADSSAGQSGGLLGVSDEVFFIIVGSVGAAVIAGTVTAIVVFRNRVQKQEKAKQHAARKDTQQITTTTPSQAQLQTGGSSYGDDSNNAILYFGSQGNLARHQSNTTSALNIRFSHASIVLPPLNATSSFLNGTTVIDPVIDLDPLSTPARGSYRSSVQTRPVSSSQYSSNGTTAVPYT